MNGTAFLYIVSLHGLFIRQYEEIPFVGDTQTLFNECSNTTILKGREESN